MQDPSTVNSVVVQKIVEHLRLHDFPFGLAQVSSLAMLMVPAAATQHMDSHGTPPTAEGEKKKHSKKHDKKHAAGKPAKKHHLKGTSKKVKSN